MKISFFSYLSIIFSVFYINAYYSQSCTGGGDQTSYGNSSWIGYVYQHGSFTNPLPNPSSGTYRGYVTESEFFNRNWGAGSPDCATDSYFAVRYKMNKDFPCGNYTFTIGSDDGGRLSIDGGATWLINRWYNTAYNTSTSVSVNISGSTDLVLEYYERTGQARVSFSYTANLGPSGLNAGLNQVTCSGENVELNGSINATSGTPSYSWSGGSIVSGGTTLTPIVNPTNTTTYTLAAALNGCTVTSSAVVTVDAVGPLTTITPSSTVACHNNVVSLSASGGATGAGSVIVWQEGSCNIAYEQNWREQPFTTPNTTVNSVNGILNVTSTNADPMIDMNGLGSFDPNTYRFMNIRYRVTAGTAGIVELFWHNALYANANAAQSKFAPLISDGNWHILTIDMITAPGSGDWLHSNVTGWRYDWATTNGVTMDLDFISLDEKRILAEGSTYTSPPLTQTTTYFASRRSDCGATSCISSTVTLPPAGTTLGNNNDVATCLVNDNNLIHFYHSSGRLLASVNSNGQNLGNVSVTSYVDSGPLSIPACDFPSNLSYTTATMGRHWVITPEFAPTSNVSVYLPFYDGEYTILEPLANGNPNTNDNLTSISDLKLTKYTGSNENNTFSDNCGTGVRTLHNNVSTGIVASVIPSILNASFATYSITSFSEFWLHGQTNSPLPVKLTNLSATCDKEVILNWTTDSEQDSDQFIVERSRDGQEWQFVGQQFAAGNSNTTINYSQIDQNSLNGVSYYRLRQTDFNGNQEVYGPISVSCLGNESSMKVYPNPNNGSFTIEISSGKIHSDAHLLLMDMTGKIIISQQVNILVGSTQVLIDHTDLSKGVYTVTLQGMDQQLKPVKVIVN